MEYLKLDQWLENHLPELLGDLERLVAINSERTEALEGMPFGQGNADCAAAAMEMVQKAGFAGRNYENYVVTADLAPECPRGLDILAHMDVVPAGEGWKVTDPFVMKVEDGRVYGRGTADDKGPALCALYAMRAIRELGLPMQKGARLVLGFDEECGSADLDYYFAREPYAPASLSPDADFPMINIEKGGLHSGFSAKLAPAESGARIVSIAGGLKVNVIPDKAQAVLCDVDRASVQSLMDEGAEGISFNCEEQPDGSLLLTARGATGHASEPEKARNAVTALLGLLARLPLCDAPIHDAVRAVSAIFPHGDCHGNAMGVAMEDEVSGKTVLSLTICHFSAEKGFTGRFDCRACLSANDENTTQVIYDQFRKAGVEPDTSRSMYEPHHVPEDSALIQTLLDVYEDMTGSRPKPLCIGGGTYVHDIENGVAFGCGFEGLDNRLHAADEFMTLDQLLFTCRIYARAILALCGA